MVLLLSTHWAVGFILFLISSTSLYSKTPGLLLFSAFLGYSLETLLSPEAPSSMLQPCSVSSKSSILIRNRSKPPLFRQTHSFSTCNLIIALSWVCCYPSPCMFDSSPLFSYRVHCLLIELHLILINHWFSLFIGSLKIIGVGHLNFEDAISEFDGHLLGHFELWLCNLIPNCIDWIVTEKFL